MIGLWLVGKAKKLVKAVMTRHGLEPAMPAKS